jgi:hypothetical protein
MTAITAINSISENADCRGERMENKRFTILTEGDGDDVFGIGQGEFLGREELVRKLKWGE